MECSWCSGCSIVTNYWADLLWFDYFGQNVSDRPHFTVNLFLEYVFSQCYDRIHKYSFYSFFFCCTYFLLFSSLYGRIENSIGCLPRFYYHNKPHIAFTESGRRNTHHEAPKYSYNWIIGSNCVERIESKTGELKINDEPNTYSRLSKQSLFEKFVAMKQKLKHIDTSNGKHLTYSDEKTLASDFQVVYCLVSSIKFSIFFFFRLNILRGFILKKKYYVLFSYRLQRMNVLKHLIAKI